VLREIVQLLEEYRRDLLITKASVSFCICSVW